MNRNPRSSGAALLLLLGAALGANGRAAAQQAPPPPPAAAAAPAPAAAPANRELADAPLATWRGDLLDAAFKSVSAMPPNPHAKNRARGQEAVVTASLELEQPRRALRYLERIDGWRRGKCYADLAFFAAQHQETTEVARLLELALQIAEQESKNEDAQDWQRDRIKVTVAKTHVLLGHAAEAAQLQANTEVFESGKVEAVKAMVIDDAAFEGEFKSLCDVLAAGSFDPSQSALETCAQLFNRFYGDEPKRSRLEEKIKSSWSKLPTQIRVDLALELAAFALRHQDRAKALALADETRALIDGSKWEPNDHLPMVARLSELRFRAGDEKTARAELAAALARYDAERDRIVDIYRAGTLRPLAEALQTTGEPAAALALYKRCVEEGVANQNSRPRADDLAATCCSMALHGVAPDAALWSRLLEVEGRLGDPW